MGVRRIGGIPNLPLLEEISVVATRLSDAQYLKDELLIKSDGTCTSLDRPGCFELSIYINAERRQSHLDEEWAYRIAQLQEFGIASGRARVRVGGNSPPQGRDPQSLVSALHDTGAVVLNATMLFDVACDTPAFCSILDFFVPSPGGKGKAFSAMADGLGNPFRRKSAGEIDEMLRVKGFDPRGPDPAAGKGGYVNPRTGRSYHIDEANSFGEPPHVDVNRLRNYGGSLPKKKYPFGE